MSSDNFRLLVGLGNPGSKYQGTRHNIGFTTLKKLANKEGVTFKTQKKLFGSLAEIGNGPQGIKLLLPETFMNESGKSIRATIDWFDLRINQVLIILDDMDLPLGRMRLREKGSSGGHNGLNSIIQHLGTQEFSRLRIGIGPPSSLIKERKRMTIPHVLGSFNKEEFVVVNKVIDEALIGIEIMRNLGINKACNYLNAFKA